MFFTHVGNFNKIAFKSNLFRRCWSFLQQPARRRRIRLCFDLLYHNLVLQLSNRRRFFITIQGERNYFLLLLLLPGSLFLFLTWVFAIRYSLFKTCKPIIENYIYEWYSKRESLSLRLMLDLII